MGAGKFVKSVTLDSRHVAVGRCRPADPQTAATHPDRAHSPPQMPWHTRAAEAWACDRAEPLLPSKMSQNRALAITLSLGATTAPF